MYVDEGFEDQAAKVVNDQLGMRINSVRNAVRVGRSSPSIWPQAEVRKAGQALHGAIDLACNVLRAMGRDLDERDLVIAREVARRAVEFKYGARWSDQPA